MKPAPAKPVIIIAHVEGSGTAAVEAAFAVSATRIVTGQRLILQTGR